MVGAFGVVVLLVVVSTLLVSLARANEVFCLSYRKQRLLVVRGYLPSALKREFEEVLKGYPGPSPCLRATSTTRNPAW